MNIGTLNIKIDDSELSTTSCQECHQKIYTYVWSGKKLFVSKVKDGEYVVHNQVCPKELAREERRRRKKFYRQKKKKFKK